MVLFENIAGFNPFSGLGGPRKLQQFKGTGISIETSDTNSSLNFLSNLSSKEKNGLVKKLRSTVSNNLTTKAL